MQVHDFNRPPGDIIESKWCQSWIQSEHPGAEVDDIPPSKDALVRNAPQDLLLEPPERALALAVQGGHVDVEEAQQRVCPVLLPRRLSARCPRESLGDAEAPGDQVGVVQGPDADAGDSTYQVGELLLRAEHRPVLGEKQQLPRGDEFLEGPSAREPSAFAEGRMILVGVLVGGHVCEVRVAHVRGLVPRIHRVDSLRQLGAARLVDAARVDPDVPVAVLARDRTCVPDFGREVAVLPDTTERGWALVPSPNPLVKSGLGAMPLLDLLQLLVRLFSGGVPGVRQYGIRQVKPLLSWIFLNEVSGMRV